jgi:hypothetical protein
VTLPVPPIDRQKLPGLVFEAKAVVRHLVPEWAGIDGPDPGTALVEACAAMVAALVERVNRAPDKERLAVLSELRVWPRPASPARTNVAFTLTVARPAPVEIPAGTQVAAQVSGGAGVGFVTTEDALLYSCTLLNGGMYRGGQYLAEQQTFTGLLSALSQEIVLTADDVLLAVLSRPVPDTQITLDLEVTAKTSGPAPAAGQLAWEVWAGTRWVACEVVEDSTSALTRSGHVTLHIPRQQTTTTVELNLGTAQAPQQWRAEDVGLLRCRQAGDAAVTVALTALALSTEMSVLVPVVQADVVIDALVGVSTGEPGQRFALPAPPLLDQGRITAQTAVHGEPPQLWSSVSSLAACGPDDLDFWLDPATGEAVFGLEAKEPGGLRRHGAIPPRRAEIRITRYLTGGGVAGNVPARSITVLRQPLPPISSVSNPSAATGGTAAENTELFSDRLPLGWIGPQRVVTAADIERSVLSTPTGVLRALHVPIGGGELLTPFTEVASWAPATSVVRFTKAPSGGTSVTVPAGTEVATADGIVFTTTHAVTVDAQGYAEAHVTQRRTIPAGTPVPSGFSNGAPGQRFRLADYPMTGTKPAITVLTPSTGPQLWTVVETFTASTSTDRHVMVNATTGEIAFGVGEYGAIPVAGSTFAVGTDYQTTRGEEGNVPVGTITRVTVPTGLAVTNNVPAQDGVNGDTAVTSPSGPYGLLVIPAVAAEAAGRLNYNDLLPSPTLRDSVERVVGPLMPPGTSVGVHAPGYQGIGVVATVIPTRALLPSDRAVLKQGAEEALYAYFNPVSGGPDHTGWPFGRPVHLGDAYSVLDRLPGVGRVRTVLLYPMSVLTGERGPETERVDVTDLSTVFSVDHQVTVEDLGQGQIR